MNDIYYFLGFVVFWAGSILGCTLTLSLGLGALVEQTREKFGNIQVLYEFAINRKKFIEWKNNNKHITYKEWFKK